MAGSRSPSSACAAAAPAIAARAAARAARPRPMLAAERGRGRRSGAPRQRRARGWRQDCGDTYSVWQGDCTAQTSRDENLTVRAGLGWYPKARGRGADNELLCAYTSRLRSAAVWPPSNLHLGLGWQKQSHTVHHATRPAPKKAPELIFAFRRGSVRLQEQRAKQPTFRPRRSVQLTPHASSCFARRWPAGQQNAGSHQLAASTGCSTPWLPKGGVSYW